MIISRLTLNADCKFRDSHCLSKKARVALTRVLVK